ncbi:MAG: ABC transporter transmembrane domain-containing protein [Parvularculaceae bacterium]|nr:ABC transporter transmembrane domain-containing protein [Parvularculaceae bacterium]
MAGGAEEFKVSKIASIMLRLLAPERDFYVLAIIYGVGISLLSLATPISVQMLINTVANTALAAPLVLLSGSLFILLLISGLLNGLRIHLMEIFGRRFYARLVAEIAVRAIYARNPFFVDEGRGPLFNRYFDIVIVQKMVPTLLVGGFTLVLQAGVGFILVSFYHPLFLAFNAVVVALIWAVWVIWGKNSIKSAIDLSHQKHLTAAWIENLAASNGFFKSERHIDYALKRTDEETRAYVDEHRRHFRRYFAQTVSFFVIYAGASATLLGLGGWLVIQGQLSLGQLVAAELVLSAVFYGISQLGPYMAYFYDLCGALEELSRFFDVELEAPAEKSAFVCSDSALNFVEVRGEARGVPVTLNFRIESGATVMAATSTHGLQRLVTTLLKRQQDPEGGMITLGGSDIIEAEPHALHQQIVLLDRPAVIAMTIREFLQLAGDKVSSAQVLEAVRIVGLDPVIARFDKGLETPINMSGWPLSITETMLLKLAAAILAEPRVLILNQLYDLVPEDTMIRVLNHLRADKSKTIIYFTRRQRDIGCDTFIYLDHHRQHVFGSFETFNAVVYEPRKPPSGGPAKPFAAIGGA